MNAGFLQAITIPPMQLSKQEREQLMQLTATPSASGHEDAVVGYAMRWSEQRKGVRGVKITRDRFGNLLLHDARTDPRKLGLILTAHMDHPAFVVTHIEGAIVTADFRGGVKESYFKGAKVRGWRVSNHDTKQGPRGTIIRYQGPADIGEERDFAQVTIDFRTRQSANWLKPGDILSWDTGKTRITGRTTKKPGRLHTLACDNLAGASAALAAWDRMRLTVMNKDRKCVNQVGVLLSRAEEVGFIGAMGACRSGIVPKGSVVIVLENSMAMPDAKLGDGPIVRVGDRTSVFDPGTTYALSQLAERVCLPPPESGLKWQRRLMTGGTCEATAYQALGYAVGCLCLPLANYHNMNFSNGKITAESIDLGDYAGLVAILAESWRLLGEGFGSSALRTRLDGLFEKRKALLDPKI